MTVHLIIVDPGHFHASLLQKEMNPALDSSVSVFAPLGPELLDYLNRIALFNNRASHPTAWELNIQTGSKSMEAVLANFGGKPDCAVVFTGRNRGKIDKILAALQAGLHVFADKPWIISSNDLPKLSQALEIAARKKLAAYDIMTERFEVTSELQRALVATPAIFGNAEAGSSARPGILARSVHHVMKVVAGVPLKRPAWFFDTVEYGEGLADVGTHVVDLVQWTAFPGLEIDYKSQIHPVRGKRWPLIVTRDQFRQVTSETEFPAALGPSILNGELHYFCNNSVEYVLAGVHVRLEISWNWQAPDGTGDLYEASFQGTRAAIEIRQGQAQNFVPEIYVVPARGPVREEVFQALRGKVNELQATWPGLGLRETGQEAQLTIPAGYRVPHEGHFAQVANRFLEIIKTPSSLPGWEASSMLAKYFVSTTGVEMAGTAE